jgi:hypothetical protein
MGEGQRLRIDPGVVRIGGEAEAEARREVEDQMGRTGESAKSIRVEIGSICQRTGSPLGASWSS